jgi:hypothetical protein
VRRAAGLALVLALVAAPAYAATGSAPVTAPDTVTVRAGQPELVDVVTNDSDPDGDELQVCLLDRPPRALRGSMVADGQLVVNPGSKARGTYTLTYYACDHDYLTPGTLTVRIRPPAPTVDVIPLGPEGRFKIVNTFKRLSFRCEWRALGSDRVEGHARVAPRSSVVVRVSSSDAMFDCTGGHQSFGFGFVSDAARR